MKDKSKTIDGVNYSTKKSELIKEYKHETGIESNSYHKLLYKTKEGKYFIRLINTLGDKIIPYREKEALNFINNFNSLF